MEARTRYLVTLEALPADRPAEVRLRSLLKFALRVLRIRCVRVVEVEEVAPRPGEAKE